MHMHKTMHVSFLTSFLLTVVVSQQRYSWSDWFGQRRIDERVHVGMVHHQTVR